MPRRNKFLAGLAIFVTIITFWITPVSAQLPFIQDLTVYSRLLSSGENNTLHSACIRLDGRCLFKLSGTDPQALTDRIYEIQKRFDSVTSKYIKNQNGQGDITIQTNNNLKDLYLTVGNTKERLFTVTNPDGKANDIGVPIRAQQLESIIERGLAVSIYEHSSQYQRSRSLLEYVLYF